MSLAQSSLAQSSLTQSSLAQFVSTGEALTDMIRTQSETHPDTWIARVGGAGWNVARVVSRLHIPSAAAVAISQDVFGEALKNASSEAGLDLRYLQQIEAPPLLAMVPETHPPQYFFLRQGAADQSFDPTKLPTGWLEAARIIYFGGISLVLEPLASRLLELAQRAKAAGKTICYDPNYRNYGFDYDPTLERMCCLADIIKVSDEDLVGLFRNPDPQFGLARVRQWNPHAAILLTKGADGADLFVGNEKYSARAPQITVMDTVGAGDACTGGFLVHLLTFPEQSWQARLEFGVATGAAACQHAGAHPPTLEEIRALLQLS
jgi:fructokinase